jgi:hypothetical protein
MRKLAAAALAALPLLAAAQEAAQPPAPPQYPPQYTPPPSYTPPPPPASQQYVPPPAYVPPPPAQPTPYVPPAPGQYAPPPQAQPAARYAPPAQYAPPPQAQTAQAQYTPPPQAQYTPPPAYAPRQPPPPPAQSFRRPEQQRDSWYIGFGLGGGMGSLERADVRLSFKEYLYDLDPTTVSLNLKVGATISPTLLLGFDISAVRSQVSESGATAAAQISNYDVVATYFPMQKGFFVRGGAGLTRFSYEEEAGGFSYSNDTSGFNVLGGVGYAFWLGRQFNLTLNADFSMASFGEQTEPDFVLPESTRYASFWIGFDWY